MSVEIRIWPSGSSVRSSAVANWWTWMPVWSVVARYCCQELRNRIMFGGQQAQANHGFLVPERSSSATR